MTAEAGLFSLVLALVLALVQSTVPLVGARRGDPRLMAVGQSTAIGQLLFVTLSFAILIALFVRSDFSVELVWAHSHTAQPLIYRVTSTWGNHEGSMVLWIFILTLFGALVALFGSRLPATLQATVLAVQGWIATVFLLFVLATSNPFARLSPAPAQGRDLNPILQDLGLAIHPPLLYAGYVGFSIAFAFAVAALIEGRVDAAWARWVRPWTLLAWSFLTVGIAIGSYWAYYELGWGGWWFWDPVENASFMPWLSGTALIHSAIVMEKRSALKIWTVLLAILTFSLSLLGTFLVRSGVLTSVHAFATDPSRGVFILLILIFSIGGALGLFAFRAGSLQRGGLFAPISREGALVLNNLLLTTACGVVLTGTLYPLALEAVTGDKISVGEPFFNATFVPLMIPLLLAVPFGPFLAWKRGDLLGATQRLYAALGVTFLSILAVYAIHHDGPVLAPLAFGLGVWLIAGALADIAERAGFARAGLAKGFARLRGMPRSAWGAALGHAGVGLTVIGIVGATAWDAERIVAMRPGDTVDLAGYHLTYQGTAPQTGPNYMANVSGFTIERDGRDLGIITSERRDYIASRQQTTEAGIRTFLFTQLYVSVGDRQQAGGRAVRVYHKPLVTLIWLGSLVMFLGGALSLSDRRLRIGAPTRARRMAAAQPAE
ncbi:heme lyase CcmF/NrfE family subunit [Lutibaculum baratangense]|uniref:Cytochrome c heme lyase subunit CcmF n=1 Tax=Lutibaculum baratangense AMV1 TaxID=631454 RepID=V4RHS1_9HYPH|nr:heme lyase CcmF/NrfE family subunit [Lutibaculum baratangense]ESR22815.1 Cytochrome c heme lyase subunit CcmF [Lutibaculum baratangense AMV1]